MKRVFILIIFLLILNVSNKVFAETWSCAYEFNGKSKPYVLSREGNVFNDQGAIFQIIFENDEVIHLYRRLNTIYFAASLFKTGKGFQFTGLAQGSNAATLKGDCVVF